MRKQAQHTEVQLHGQRWSPENCVGETAPRRDGLLGKAAQGRNASKRCSCGRPVWCLLLSALALSLLLGGCGAAQKTDKLAGAGVQTSAAESGSPVSAVDAQPQEAAAGTVYPLELDNYGRTVRIEHKPQKVLTLGPNCTELFAALGLESYVVGRSLVNHSRGPLPEYKEAVDKIPQLNYGSATREAILSSGADFIYTIDWELGQEGCNPEELARFGTQVYVNQADSLDKIYQEIRDIGRIFGIEQRAEAFVREQQDRIAAVQAARPKDAGPVRVLVYDSGNDGVFTCSGSNFESRLIELAGGENIFGDMQDKQWITVSYEEVLKRRPDIILIHDYDSPGLEEKLVQIKNNPVLSQLPCVQEERFASLSLESVLPGDRMAYAVEQMAGAFYP